MPQYNAAASSNATDAPTHAIVLCNLGTPDAPDTASVRRYLAEFLSDRRVVELPALLWKLILHGIILRTRPAKSARKYQSIWYQEGSPLLIWTQKQAVLLRGYLGEAGHAATILPAMRYGNPSIAQQLDAALAGGCEHLLIFPQYPQYSATTTASVCDAVFQWTAGQRRVPALRFIDHYCDHPAYIQALATRIRDWWMRDGRGEHLLLSFHGIPQRNIRLGDPYHEHCQRSARLLAAELGLADSAWTISFQSRFGAAKWLEPDTEGTLKKLAANGIRNLDIFCPGFTCDCLETLEEIAMEGKETFLQAGGSEFNFIPCLNDHPAWIRALRIIAEENLAGWKTRHKSGSAGLPA